MLPVWYSLWEKVSSIIQVNSNSNNVAYGMGTINIFSILITFL